jgi:hypothetical protein
MGELPHYLAGSMVIFEAERRHSRKHPRRDRFLRSRLGQECGILRVFIAIGGSAWRRPTNTSGDAARPRVCAPQDENDDVHCHFHESAAEC